MSFEERIERLEQQVGQSRNRVRWLLVVLVMLVGGLVLASAPAPESVVRASVVRASGFELADRENRVRARLTLLLDKTPTLDLVDEQGTVRASLFIFQGTAQLALSDERGKARLTLAVDKDGPVLALADEKGGGRAVLGRCVAETPGGGKLSFPESSLVLFGADGKVAWRAP